MPGVLSSSLPSRWNRIRSWLASTLRLRLNRRNDWWKHGQRGDESSPAQPWEFRSKPAWQRLIVMIAGVTMNVTRCRDLYHGINEVRQTVPQQQQCKRWNLRVWTCNKSRFGTGDKVVAIDGKPPYVFRRTIVFTCIVWCYTYSRKKRKNTLIFVFRIISTNKPCRQEKEISLFLIRRICLLTVSWVETRMLQDLNRVITFTRSMEFVPSSMESCRKIINENKSKPITLKVLRGTDTLMIQPVVNDSGMIGITYRSDFGSYPMTDYTFGSAIDSKLWTRWRPSLPTSKDWNKFLREKKKWVILCRDQLVSQTIYGGIWDWKRFWAITGLLSMTCFHEHSPIPALDGGHVLFSPSKWITRQTQR